MSASASVQSTLATALWPANKQSAIPRAALLAFAGSAFVALSAQIEVPLWPVPITGQTFAVLIVGMVLGCRLGAASLALYMAEGAIGIPVFAKFSAGFGVLMGPTGGYIAGFVLAAAIVGYLAERGWDRNPGLTALAMLIGNLAIYLPGLPWLAIFLAGIGSENPAGAAIAGGLTPFLVGDALKLALAACLLPVAWRLVGWTRATTAVGEE